MEPTPAPSSPDPIIITSHQLLAFWEELGATFQPEIDPELATDVLQEIESNLTVSLVQKLDILALLSQMHPPEIQELINYLQSIRNSLSSACSRAPFRLGSISIPCAMRFAVMVKSIG
jgi:capsule polysaccharide export protein KpsE/RkpR